MGKVLLGIDQSTVVARYLVFRIVFQEEAELPAWKGNILRGAIGSLLAKACGFEKLNCQRCNLWSQCPYGYLYRARSKGIVLSKLSGISKPFVLKPPLVLDKVFRPGDELVFSIVLFGDAIRFEKDVILSILDLGRRGIGIKDRRGKFIVSEITTVNPYQGFESILYKNNVFYESRALIKYSDLVAKARELTRYNGFTIKFLTPFRLLSKNNIVLPVNLEVILKYALRRFTNIFAQYMYVLPEINVHELLNKASKLELSELELREKTIVYRGKPEEYYIGELSFTGEIDEEIALILIFTELAHIGKRASYGHGWIKLLARKTH